MKYDLWDISARFFFDRFASEDEALTFVRALLDEYGEPYANDLELVIGDGGHQNLSGAALIARSVACPSSGLRRGAKPLIPMKESISKELLTM